MDKRLENQLEEGSTQERNHRATLGMCPLHSQQRHPPERVSIPGVECLEEGRFRVGGQGALTYYVRHWERRTSRNEACVPLERKNGCWAAGK